MDYQNEFDFIKAFWSNHRWSTSKGWKAKGVFVALLQEHIGINKKNSSNLIALFIRKQCVQSL